MRNETTILIVDHDENVLITLEWTPEEAGYSTVTAWSIEEALRLSERAPFDLLLIDEHLVDLDSSMFVGTFKQLQPNATLLLMHTGKDPAGKLPGLVQASVCKWEHDEVKVRVHSCLATLRRRAGSEFRGRLTSASDYGVSFPGQVFRSGIQG